MLLDCLTGNLTLESLPPCNLTNCTKEEIKAYLINSYELGESLFVGLKDESCLYGVPDRLRLPLVFYYAHTAVVYVNKVILADLAKPSERVNFEFEVLFETGVDEMSWDDTENYRMGGSFKWPSLRECVDYRRKVKEFLLDIIDRTPLKLPVTMENPWWAIFMGMEHERIHLETSSVLIRQLPIEMVETPPGWKYAPEQVDDNPIENPLIRVPVTQAKLGKPIDFPTYGWDNEYGCWEPEVPAFDATKHLTTNGEFMAFVKDGGYNRKEFWSRAGWQWKQFGQRKHPTFWVCTQECKSGCAGTLNGFSHCKREAVTPPSGYRLRTTFKEIDLPLSWPVCTNFHEAKAYCKWLGSGYRLLTEAEHTVLKAPVDMGLLSATENDPPLDVHVKANTQFQFGSSTPVNMFEPNALGFTDLYGNVWEWVEDHFNGLPGYPGGHYLYDDYSTPCCDGLHGTMVGASWASTGNSCSRFVRYSFRRHFMQHAGFRVAKSADPNAYLPIRLVIANEGDNERGTIEESLAVPHSDLRPGFVESTNPQIVDNNQNTTNFHLNCELDVPDEWNLAKLTTDRFLVTLSNMGLPKIESVLVLGVGGGKLVRELGHSDISQVLGLDPRGCLVDCAQVRFDEWKSRSNPNIQAVFKQFTWIPNEVKYFDAAIFAAVDEVANAKAWCVRFPEVLQDNGVLMVVSPQAKFGSENLSPMFNSRLTLTSEFDLPWKTGQGKEMNARVTTWVKDA